MSNKDLVTLLTASITEELPDRVRLVAELLADLQDAKPVEPGYLSTRRKMLGISQTDFSRMVGVSRNTVARWEHGDLAMPRFITPILELLLDSHEF